MKEILSKIDHSILKATSTSKDVIEGAKTTLKYNFATLCVFPKHIKVAREILPSEKVATVIGFPLHTIPIKLVEKEIEYSLKAGAFELDIVLDIGLVKEKKFSEIEKNLKRIREFTNGYKIKLILECCYLTTEEKKKVGKTAVDIGWDFLKTSTGYGKYGATEEDVKLLREIAENRAKVKASGGIRTLKEALKFVTLGADRIGTSSGVKIAEEILNSRKV